MSTVLVVDDEPKMRELLVRWLTPTGHEIKQAGDAASGLEIATSSRADVVLCDITMPGKDGLWLVAMLRSQLPDVAIVLATAVDEIPGSVSLQEGVVGYLLKPFSADRVLKAVKDALEWRQNARARAARPSASSDSIADWLDGKSRPTVEDHDE